MQEGMTDPAGNTADALLTEFLRERDAPRLGSARHRTIMTAAQVVVIGFVVGFMRSLA